ncbi:group I intron-associated PD-(D/E)XK endonuclease [Salarchaeum japonicum]|uniref:group I intron-associated PD-(D/E)XK endonuclease n=1 Tax=Salarchaeum japonicum TaxID=555573 RepID=UPI003C70834A
MVNTKETGDVTETRLLHELVAAGYSVSVPFGDNDPYDLVVDTGDEFVRVQCKTGWLEDGRIRFKTASKTTENGKATTTDYDGKIDAFMVRCKDTESVYWVPVEDAGRKNTYLRVEDADIDHPSINWASGFEFSGVIG